MDLTDQHKKDVERKLVDAMILALEHGKLGGDEVSVVADFILQKIDTLKTHHDLLLFLDELATKWPAFAEVDVIEHAEEQKTTEQEATHNVEDLIHHGDIDAAIEAAKKVTNEHITAPEPTVPTPTPGVDPVVDLMDKLKAAQEKQAAAAQNPPQTQKPAEPSQPQVPTSDMMNQPNLVVPATGGKESS